MRYEAPETMEAAVELLSSDEGARVLAGGTDLLVQLRAEMIEPSLVVDVKRIAAMREITKENDGIRVGAAVAGAELDEHEDFKATWPGVLEAFELIGSTQIQGRATMGGNLCNASPAADSVPAMIAAGATATILGPGGQRDVPVEDIAIGPGQTSLDKGELVTSFFFPKPAPRTGDAYLRFIPRTEMDIAVVGAGICLTLDDSDICKAARVSLGAVAARALVVDEAADALIGTPVDEAALAKLAEAASAAAKPIDDKRGTKEFRVQVMGVMARRTAEIALARAKAN
tara:strand:- start:3177 stop:4034 length:858 start_codon:yes stop_codon:yes gene_type:complete